ncbi:MAG: WD40 repeat domain-containing protein, partial [Pseudomonadota bacterium]
PAYRHVGGQFSATGRHLALTRKGPMRLIDTFADKVLAEIELYPYSKNYAFSPDGHWFAATRQALTAQLWDLKSLRTLRLGAGQSPVTAVAFTHDSKAVAYITREGVFTVQELGSNRRLTRYKVELSAPASQLALSPDGTEFAIVTREGLAFHRTGDGGLLLYERLPTQSLRTLQYTADGERLVFAFETTKTEVQVTDDLGNARTVTNRVSLNWARRGAELQVASPLPLDRKARHQSTLYLDLAPEEAQALAEPATPDNTFNKLAIHLGNQAKIIGAAMGPDDTIVTVNEKSEVYLTDIATMKTQAIWRLRGLPAVDVHMDRDGKIRVARADGRTETLDPATADAHFSAVSLQRLTDLVAISTNGAYGAYISHEDLAFVVISLSEDETLWRIPRQQRTVFRGFAVSNDGSALATEQSEDTIAVHLKDGTVQILDPATIALPGWREGQKSYADVMAFSADGSRLLTGGGHRSASSLVVWDVATGTAIYAMAPTGSRLSAAAFIPGANAVIGYWDTFGAHVLPLDRVPPNVMVLQTGKQGYAELSSGFRPRFIGPARAVTSRGRGLAVIDALTDTTLGFIGTAGVTGGKHISVVGTDPDTGQILTWHRDTRQIGRWRDPVPPGDAFQVICALLPRQDGAVPLDDIVPGYPIAIRDRICDADYDPPLPDWVPQLPGAVR